MKAMGRDTEFSSAVPPVSIARAPQAFDSSTNRGRGCGLALDRCDLPGGLGVRCPVG
jgi:hypothetical protein